MNLTNNVIKFYLALLSLYSELIIAQDCVPITSSIECPSFSSLSISKAGPFPLQEQFPPYTLNTNSFDTYVSKFTLLFLDNIRQRLQNPYCLSLIGNSFQGRYAKTLACAQLLNNSCQSGISSCLDVCNAFAESLKWKLFSTGPCNSLEIDEFLFKLKEICHSTSYWNQTEHGCIEGPMNEPSICGFADKSLAYKYCQSSNDPCCGNFNQVRSLLDSNETFNNSSTTESTDSSDTDSKIHTVLVIALPIAIAVSILIILLVLLGVVRRSRRRKLIQIRDFGISTDNNKELRYVSSNLSDRSGSIYVQSIGSKSLPPRPSSIRSSIRTELSIYPGTILDVKQYGWLREILQNPESVLNQSLDITEKNNQAQHQKR